MKGPCRIVRHPIYTGLILAVAGTGLALDKGIWLFAVMLIFASYWLKIRVEERLMMATFPGDYPEYRRRVKALIPGILLGESDAWCRRTTCRGMNRTRSTTRHLAPPPLTQRTFTLSQRFWNAFMRRPDPGNSIRHDIDLECN